MTVGAADADIGCVYLMWKIDRLLGGGLDTQEVPGRVTESCVRCCKRRRAPSPRLVRIECPVRIAGYIRLLHASKNRNAD